MLLSSKSHGEQFSQVERSAEVLDELQDTISKDRKVNLKTRLV